MTTTITESNEYPASLQIPSNGEAVTGSTFLSLFAQRVGNRFKFIKTILDAGVPRIQVFISYAALKAYEDMADGDVALVWDGSTIRHLFVYDGDSTAGEITPFVVEPTSGTGRWINLIRSLLSISGSPLKARLTGVLPYYSTIVRYHVSGTPDSYTSTSDAPVTGLSTITFSTAILQDGDIIEIEGLSDCYASSGSGYLSIGVSDGTTVTRVQERALTGTSTPIPFLTQYTISDASKSYTVNLYGRAGLSSTLAFTSGRTAITARLIRP